MDLFRHSLGEPTSVIAFAVANNGLSSAYSVTTNAGVWAAGIISASAWDAGQGVIANAFAIPIVPLFSAVFPAHSKAVVYYAESLLDATEREVIAGLGWSFLNRLSSDDHDSDSAKSKPILAFTGITGGFGFFSSSPGSPFVALTMTTPLNPTFGLVSGMTVDTIVGTPPIPEPSQFALLLAGNATLTLLASRRRLRHRPAP